MKPNTKIVLPKLGFGSVHCKDPVSIVYEAIKSGIRLIDTASSYKNETEVGQGIKKAIDEGIVKREDLFVVTKTFVHERKDPITSLKNSLQRLQLDYVDLFLDHWPTLFSYVEGTPYPLENMVPMHKVWPQIEKCYEDGLAKNIGVSNYNIQSLCNLFSFCKYRPAVLEVEFHPYCYQKNLKWFCDKENISMIGYCPMVRGNTDLFSEEVICSLSQKYGKTKGQIILNWEMEIGVSPIPGTSKIERIKENVGALDFKMEKEDIDKISGLNKMFRVCPCELKLGGLDIFA